MTQSELDFTPSQEQSFNFDGDDYNPDLDQKRLTGQICRIYREMISGKWLTVDEIAAATNDPQTSVSAQIRNLRKPAFGGHFIPKRRRVISGLYEFKLTVNPESKIAYG